MVIDKSKLQINKQIMVETFISGGIIDNKKSYNKNDFHSDLKKKNSILSNNSKKQKNDFVSKKGFLFQLASASLSVFKALVIDLIN